MKCRPIFPTICMISFSIFLAVAMALPAMAQPGDVLGQGSEYFPLLPGAYWTYAVNGNASTTQTMTVQKKQVVINGVSTMAVKASGSNNLSYYTSDENGVRLHGFYYPKANVGGSHHRMKVVFSPPITVLAPTVTEGQSGPSSGVATATVSGHGTVNVGYSWDYSIDGVETVDTPAGSYGALRVTTDWSLDNQQLPSVVSYYVKGLGDAKDTSEAETLELLATNADIYDLAVTKIVAPKTVTLKTTTPNRSGTVKVTIQNRSSHAEVIKDTSALNNLVSLSVNPLGSCSTSTPLFVSTSPGKAFPIAFDPGKSITFNYTVTFSCANDPQKTSAGVNHNDFEYSAMVNHTALDGNADTHSEDDMCPRTVSAAYTDPSNRTITDKGCGSAKPDRTFGGAIATDVVK